MLGERADDCGIAGIGQERKRVPEPEGGLQWPGVGVQSMMQVNSPPSASSWSSWMSP